MNNRSAQLTYFLCVGGTLVFLAIAIGQFAASSSITSAKWGSLLACVLFAVAALQARKSLDHSLEAARQWEEHREAAQRSLDQQRQAIDALADGLDVAIFVCDGKAVIQYANRRAIEMFKIEDAAGRSLLAMTLSYDLEQLALEAFRMRASRNAEQQFAYPIDRVGVAKAWPSEANPEHVFVSIYEITDLRRLERVRQDFVSNVSHELRTPLTIIRSMAETLLDDPVPDPELSAKYLPRIISEVDRLSMISNDLLILSAAESNPVRKSSCDVADVFRGVLDQLSSRAHEKGLEIKYTGPQHLEVEANPSQFTQVAINLIENAINYTNHGSVEVAVAEEDGHAVVNVNDTGLGIASEHQPRVFERFYRVDKARSRHSGGTGLGLSIVKHIVESHGGRVSVASTLNQGSTFTIRIPIGRPHADGETIETT